MNFVREQRWPLVTLLLEMLIVVPAAIRPVDGSVKLEGGESDTRPAEAKLRPSLHSCGVRYSGVR